MLSVLEPLEGLVAGLLKECSSLPREDVQPVLFTKPSTSRPLRIDKLSHMLAEAETYLVRLRQLQTDVTTATQLLESYRSMIIHAPSPVAALPDEVLSMIFASTRSGKNVRDRTEPTRTARTLSHVCSRWRAVMLSIPSFWTVLPITAHATEEMMLVYAHRAAGERLTLQAIGTSPAKHEVTISIPIEVLDKLQTVELTAPHHTYWLHYAHPPPLRTLRLGPSTRPPTSHREAHRFHIDAEDTRYLDVTTLICYAAWIHDPMNEMKLHFFRLETLEIAAQMGVDAHQLLSDLYAPELRTLRLTDLRAGVSSPDSGLKITKHIESLYVVGDEVNAAVAGQLLMWGCRQPEEGPEFLHLGIISRAKSALADWENGLTNLLAWASEASVIELECTLSSLSVVLDLMTRQRFFSVSSLTITAVHSKTRHRDGVSEQLIKMNQTAIARYLRAREEAGVDLIETLCISRCLVDGEGEGIAEFVDSLDIRDD